MSKPCLRGCGDTISRRLASVRADILARGKSIWHVHACGRRGAPIVCKLEAEIPRAFALLRRRGVSVATVIHLKSLCGYSVCVDKGVDWLLLSSPVLISSPRYERSESAERKNGKVVK